MSDGPEKPKPIRTVARDEKGRLLPGCANLNPGGRPKGLASRIRAETRDGDEIIDLLTEVIRDKQGTTRDRLDAARILLERGYGKAPELSVVMNADASTADAAVAALAEGQLEALARALAPRSTPEPPEPLTIPAEFHRIPEE